MGAYGEPRARIEGRGDPGSASMLIINLSHIPISMVYAPPRALHLPAFLSFCG